MQALVKVSWTLSLNEDALELYLLQSVEKHDDLDDMLHSCN